RRRTEQKEKNPPLPSPTGANCEAPSRPPTAVSTTPIKAMPAWAMAIGTASLTSSRNSVRSTKARRLWRLLGHVHHLSICRWREVKQPFVDFLVRPEIGKRNPILASVRVDDGARQDLSRLWVHFQPDFLKPRIRVQGSQLEQHALAVGAGGALDSKLLLQATLSPKESDCSRELVGVEGRNGEGRRLGIVGVHLVAGEYEGLARRL